MTKDDILELAIVVVVSCMILGFGVFALLKSPAVFDMRDFPTKDIGVNLE
jgi:hypothetical protein